MAKNTTPPTHRKALGKGLGALLSSKTRTAATAAVAVAPAVAEDSVAKLAIELIDPNPAQPRTEFRPEALEELAQSIRVDGLIQPIVVRPNGSRFLLVVGERRLRAAKLAGLATISAIVREFEPENILEVALVENIQREDLNPIEIALALEQMIKDLGLSHEELASRTGKSRTNITNHLRLLKLPAEIKELLQQRRLQMGHARALLAIEDPDAQRALADRAVAQELSVREVERLVRKQAEPKHEESTDVVDPNVAAAIEELERALGTPVAIHVRGRGGRIEIFYGSQDDLDRIYDHIVGDNS